MPIDDIRPFASQNGGHDKIQYFRMGALTTATSGQDTSWERGYWMINNAGQADMDVATDGDDPVTVGSNLYVAAASSAGLIQSRGGTDGAATHAIRVPVYDPYSGMEFKTRNVFSGDDTNLGPISGGGDGTMTGILVGTTYNVWVDDSTATMVGHVHGLDLAGDFFEITRLIDDLGEDTYISGNTVDWIIFRAVPRIS